jgi:sec-independent protein translocase protein TatA
MPTTLLFLEFIGTAELLVIGLVALIIFGPRKLPEIGRTVGKTLAEFKRASEDFKRTWEYEVETERRQLSAAQETRPAAAAPAASFDTAPAAVAAPEDGAPAASAAPDAPAVAKSEGEEATAAPVYPVPATQTVARGAARQAGEEAAGEAAPAEAARESA